MTEEPQTTNTTGWYASQTPVVMPTPRAIDEPLPTSSQAPRIYTIAVIAAAAAAILALLLCAGLAFAGRTVPPELGSIGTIAMTALSGMLGYAIGKQGA